MAKKQRLLITEQEARDLYEKQKVSINAIAKSKGVHPDLLRRDLIYLGFEIRSEKQKPNVFRYTLDIDKTLEALALGIWLGEGTKRGKRVEVTNCDPLILRVWLSFLIKICNVDAKKLKLRIQLHDASLKAIAFDFWLKELGLTDLPISCSYSIKKTIAKAEAKRPMGTVTLSYNSVPLIHLVQQRAVGLANSLM